MGLSSSKTTSERHEEAKRRSDLITAGALAKAMRRFGMSVKASELNSFASEWHHAGWISSSRMGKCYFFDISYLDPEKMKTLYERVLKNREEESKIRYAYRIGFIKKYDGPYGRKRWQPILEVKEFKEGEKINKNKKYMEIDKETYDLLKTKNGMELKPYQSIEELKLEK